MDPTQKIDTNRTMLTGVPNFNDPLKTQAIPGYGAQTDPNRTSAIAMPSFMGKALAITVTPSREATMANGPAREQFLIEISAAGQGGAQTGVRTPLNLCLCIDRSGSMEGQPLEYVKQACCHVVDLMSQDDVLSIVTFEEIVDVLMPPQRVTNKQMVKDGIMRLTVGNTTNIYDALTLGLQQVTSLNDPSRVTRLVILTDGDPTAGIKDFHALVQHAASIKDRGISLTFLGFGPDYNEELIASMAKKGGGNYYFIPRPELIPEVFRTELEKMMTVSARNLVLDISLARWVSSRAPQQSDTGYVVNLTDLERGTTIEQVLDLDFTNHPLGHYRVAGGRLTYDDIVSGHSEAIDIDFVLEFTADTARHSVEAHPRVRQAAQVAQASKAVEKTMMGMKTGQLTAMGAIADLQRTQALLLGEGRTAEAQEVTMALRALQSGDAAQAEKTLMGAVFNLDQGKKQN